MGGLFCGRVIVCEGYCVRVCIIGLLYNLALYRNAMTQ